MKKNNGMVSEENKKVEVIDAEKLTPDQQFLLRKQIVRLRQQGKTTREVVELLGVRERHVQSTWKRYRDGGIAAVSKKVMGRPKGSNRKLSKTQEKEIRNIIIDKNPEQLKLKGCMWDRKNIRDLIKHEFKMDIPLSTLGYYLARWGFTAQRPNNQNYKQKPEAVQKWLNEEYPVIKARAKQEQGDIYWSDETGIQNETNYARGYAPIGQTPTMKVSTERVRINMISAVTNQGKLKFMIYKEAMNQQRLIEFMTRLVKDSSRKVFLILDNLTVHHGKIAAEWLSERKKQIEVFFLPAYAPEYNPDEYLNGNLKQEIGRRPHSRTNKQLESMTRGIMKKMQLNKSLVSSFFKHKKVAYAAADES
jgi:transposase